MRIGSSIIFFNGYCYQSYNWATIRPLGKLQTVIDFLEKYQCDEITIIRPIRDNDNEELLKKDINLIMNTKSMTPLSFGGGLRKIMNIDLLHNLPVERLIFSSAFINKDLKLIQYATDLYGRQAIQCLLPFFIENDELYIFNSKSNKFVLYTDIDLLFVDKYANEIILIDTQSEGHYDKFTFEVLNKLNINRNKLVISGGIGVKNIKKAELNNIASVLIDNKVLHTEYSIKGFRNAK